MFDTLGKALTSRTDYLSRCVAVDEDSGDVPHRLSTYTLGDALNKSFWALQWSTMDMVNSDSASPNVGGFLSLRYLENGTVYAGVASADYYVVESTLTGIRPWFNRLLLGIGFAAAVEEGYTWFNVVDRQMEVVRYIDGLPVSERAGWRLWADNNFRFHALERAQTLLRDKLMTTRPADEVVSYFLPPGAAFFANITTRLKDAEPISVVRRAFPTYFPSAPVSLPGTSAQATASTPNPSGSGGKRPGKEVVSGGGSDAPGSKSTLAKVLADGQLFLGGTVIDTAGVAKQLGVTGDSLCWPVLFTNKKGAAALSICPNHVTHGGLNTKYHKPPSSFDRGKLLKKFSKPATAEQLKEAGWRVNKKAKI